MEKYKQTYRIPSARLKGFDYGSNGLYFITICTHQRIHYFGEIVEPRNCASGDHPVETRDCASNLSIETGNRPSLRATEIGRIAHQYWSETPQHYPFVELDEFVVMPNHIHGILFFNRPDKIDWAENKFGVQSRNLASVIRGFKSSVKRYANQNFIEFAWQSRFHDVIVKNGDSLQNIREYIINNPVNWNQDEMNANNNAETHNRASLQENI